MHPLTFLHQPEKFKLICYFSGLALLSSKNMSHSWNIPQKNQRITQGLGYGFDLSNLLAMFYSINHNKSSEDQSYLICDVGKTNNSLSVGPYFLYSTSSVQIVKASKIISTSSVKAYKRNYNHSYQRVDIYKYKE